MHTPAKLLFVWIAAALAACSVEPVTFKKAPVAVGGTVSGLAGTGLVLTNNGGDDLPITGNGAFAFATPVERGAAYALAVKTQPTSPEQECTIANGSGATGDGDVTDVAVTCRTLGFDIGGTVSGLAGTGLVLQNNGGDDLAVSADGAFTFFNQVPSGESYEVTVAAQPAQPTQACTVARGTGTVAAAAITDVEVACVTRSFSIGGTITGLAPGNSITLRNNGGDDLVRTTNGGFQFATAVPSGQAYTVTVLANPTSPIAQTCTVANGAGVVGGADVTDVQITCTTNTYTIGGTVTGLTSTGLVLRNNGGDDLSITMNGPFTFATAVASGAAYNVTIRTQPSNQTCKVESGAGTVGASNVTNILVSCSNDWSTSLFPIAVPGTTNTLGDLVLDGNGDLLVTLATSRSIVRVNRLTGGLTTVASGIGTGTFLLGVTYRAANNMIYTNTDTQILAVTPAGSVSLLVGGITGFLNAITIAPASFGPYGGFIIGITNAGTLIAVNPTNGALTTFATGVGAASDLAFAPNGTLYISGGTTVRTVTAAGVAAPFASGFSSADGITITPDGGRAYVADSGTDTVRQVTIPGAVVTTFAAADIDGGFGVGGILAAPGNTLIVITGTGSLTLRAFAY